MTHFAEWRLQVAELCCQAANGGITIDEFYRRWPTTSTDSEDSDFAQQIFEDLEEGIQHFPAKLFSGAPDYQTWYASDLYRRLIVDEKVIRTDLGERQLIELRNQLLRE